MKEIEIPDGSGGYKKVMAEERPGQTAKNQPQQERFAQEQEKAAWERIGYAAEAFNRYHKAYGTDSGLSQEELVAAAYLENLNLREFYPPELGGPEGYDKICKEVWEWFEKNKRG